MPPDAVKVPPETPNRVRHSFDKIIVRLNTVWNLNLPSIHGSQENALQQADAEQSLAKKCAGRIRYLCWRDCQLDKVISDFEEDAARICSPQWVWKPSQEKGTLPKMPVTKSFISTRPPLVTKDRQKLLECLFVVLDEEYKLARESDVYRRTSFNGAPDTAGYARTKADHSGMSVGTSRTVDPEAANEETSGKSYHGIQEGKSDSGNARELVKRKSCGPEMTVKSWKKQMTLSEMRAFPLAREPAKDARGISSTIKSPSSHQNGPTTRSFGSSTISKVPTDIFTSASASLLATPPSATTSCLGEAEMPSPDLFPSQDVMDIERDETFNTSFQNLCEPTEADLLLSELCAKTPFQQTELPHKLSLRHRYELQRVADALRITPKEVLNDLRRERVSSTDDHEKFWAAALAIAKGRGCQLPERSSASAWTSATDSFFENKTRERSVYLSGTLSFKSKVDEGLLDLTLKPLYLDKSCRFHRKYGPSRFMLLTLPQVSADHPSKVKEKERSGVLCEALARWLATAHQFLGRKWRAFFLEEVKKKHKQDREYKINLFAVSGDDLSSESATEIHQLLNWHMPFRYNLKSTNLKLFQRLSLGLSKTLPTITLETFEFIRLADPEDHAVMNDGCARMSKTLAKDISQLIGLTDVPSVFQGRIGGAKGLWMVVPDDEFPQIGKRRYCIEIADSQLKLLPHPKDNWTADDEQRTFEVLNYSKPGRAAAMKNQLVTVLYDRGVPRDILGKLLVADMGNGYNELELSMRSDRVRSWVQSYDMYSRSEEGTGMTGSWPENVAKQSILLIESGFTPDTSSVLRKCLCDMFSKCLDQTVEQLRIRVPCSTFLFCIADPYGVLEPNEVHLSFSEVWNDPISGFRECFVDGKDVLVARLPALLPSDVQRRQAVWKRELHHFKDVVVFPTKGEIPLAHMLSGGDYDGDKPWICWDPEVVSRFKNADLPELPSKKDCGLVQQNRKMTDVLSQGASGQHFASQIDSFLTGCFAFNLNSSYTGQCTNEHERVVYFEGSLSSPSALKLAALCGYLVDSAKQGDRLTAAAWKKLRNQVSPQKRDNPAYKNEKYECHRRQSNILDYLKFWQAIPEKKRILTDLHHSWPPQPSDSTLSQPWISMQGIRKSERSSPQLRKILDQLEKDVAQVAKTWASLQRGEGRWPPGEFTRVVERTCSQLRAIEPSEAIQESSHPWVTESGKKFGHWSLLRASCFYNRYPAGKMVWHIAGEELCHIKAQASPAGYRPVVRNIHSLLKCDTKMAKRAQERLDDDDDDDDAETYGWDDTDAVEMMQQGD